MTSLDQLTADLAADVARKAAPLLVNELIAAAQASVPNPLMTCKEAAKYLGIGITKLRELVTAGVLKKAPGIVDIRIRKSVLDAWGVENPKKK